MPSRPAGSPPTVLTPRLLEAIRAQYRLDWHGIHGLPHWLRVRRIGLRLAERTGALPAVVELFAVFHDACRENDRRDDGHGARGAALAAALQARLFPLPAGQLSLLRSACAEHTAGRTAGDVTLQTCWDADRLDLGRIGTRPDPAQLCTEAAREPRILAWAYRESLAPGLPSPAGLPFPLG